MLIGQGGISGLTNGVEPLSPLQNLQGPVAFSPLSLIAGGLREPSYNPRLASLEVARLAPQSPSIPSQTPKPYALPLGSTLSEVAGGIKAQPFDVTLSKLATAVYGTRGDPPEGWSPVSDTFLASRGIDDPNTWRQTYLGGGEQTTAQQFKAEIYTDGEGNFVLSYRGTAEGMADWENNFKQGTGFATGPVDKFTGTAVSTAEEFAEVFGDRRNGAPANLAITGHSQGGGLASVGSLATGIPAVTFDASGIHPNTLERMGIADPQQARDTAEGGQIRAYSLKSDLLTRLQESGPLSLAAPDALGTKIVVEPSLIDRHTLTGRGAKHEFDLPILGQAGVNTIVEMARNSGVPIINDIGQLAYNAISHSPNLLTDAMIDRQPWQAGYQNPSDLSKTLHDLVPEALRDDFARNTHEVASEVAGVVKTDIASGAYLQGTWKIGGHLVDSLFSAAGDTVHHGAESLARRVGSDIEGPVGDVLSIAISGGGRLAQTTAHKVGDGMEMLTTAQGAIAQDLFDGAMWLGGKAVEGTQWAADKAAEGAQFAAEKFVEGANWSVDRMVEGGNWVADKAVEPVDLVKDTAVTTGRAIADTVSRTMPWNW